MNDIKKKTESFKQHLEEAKDYLIQHLSKGPTSDASVHIYTHLDADGLTAGAILGKALFRANISFQITVLKQLEREEIIKLSKRVKKSHNFLIFSDFGSGQYKVLLKYLKEIPFLVLDHHLPQDVEDNTQTKKIQKIFKKTRPWHLNPYFFGFNGSLEVSGSGMAYFFVKILNEENKDLSSVALIGATGDIQTKGENKSFTGLNEIILKDAKDLNLIEISDDLNFSSIKPLNEAIAYSSEINLPGLTNNANKSLKFLQQLGILMENADGKIRTLSDLTKDEKQKISSAIIEYATLKLDIEPQEIIEDLIINRYLLRKEKNYSDLYDCKEFANVLNACGRTNSASLGIAIAMGDRTNAYKKAKQNQKEYKKSIMKALNWLKKNEIIKQKEFIQYFFGEEVITENIVGTVASMLIFSDSEIIDKNKPIIGLAERVEENVFKISARANRSLVEKGVNLSEVLREACKLSEIDVLGGGHPPAAGTKIPTDTADLFLKKCNLVVKKQLMDRNKEIKKETEMVR
ncbi:MAG: DHH family phosphoesterase [Promethearchaeia archaeon]